MRKCKPTLTDESIPEEDRIYSPDRQEWCIKTTKESADLLLRNFKQTMKDLETRGTQRVILQRDDWHNKSARELPLKNNPDFRIDVHYIHDGTRGGYRMYTDDTKYGEHKEIIFDKDKQYFVIRNIDRFRRRWNDTHRDNDGGDDDGAFDDFCNEKI